MKLIIFLGILVLNFFPSFANIEARATLHYEIQGKKVFMEKIHHEITLNQSCARSKKCEAYKLSKKKIALHQIKSEWLRGGKNPGSIVCTKFLNGIVVIGYHHTKEQSFCLFKDKSLVSTNSLWE
jgi:hypothetical protein